MLFGLGQGIRAFTERQDANKQAAQNMLQFLLQQRQQEQENEWRRQQTLWQQGAPGREREQADYNQLQTLARIKAEADARANQPIGIMDVLRQAGPENFAQFAPMVGKTEQQAGQWLTQPVTTATPKALPPMYGPVPVIPNLQQQPRYKTMNLRQDPYKEAQAEWLNQKPGIEAGRQATTKRKESNARYAMLMRQVYSPYFSTLPFEPQQNILASADAAMQELGMGRWSSKPVVGGQLPSGRNMVYDTPDKLPPTMALASLSQIMAIARDSGDPDTYYIAKGLFDDLYQRYFGGGGGAGAPPGVRVPQGGMAPAPVLPGALPSAGYAPPPGVPRGFAMPPKSGKAILTGQKAELGTIRTKQEIGSAGLRDVRTRQEIEEAAAAPGEKKQARLSKINERIDVLRSSLTLHESWVEAKDTKGNLLQPPNVIADLREAIAGKRAEIESLKEERATLLGKKLPPAEKMDYRSIARRWGFKGGRQVVNDQDIQKLASAVQAFKRDKVPPRKWGPQWREATRRLGYTTTEADRLFRIFMTQVR